MICCESESGRLGRHLEMDFPQVLFGGGPARLSPIGNCRQEEFCAGSAGRIELGLRGCWDKSDRGSQLALGAEANDLVRVEPGESGFGQIGPPGRVMALEQRTLEESLGLGV